MKIKLAITTLALVGSLFLASQTMAQSKALAEGDIVMLKSNDGKKGGWLSWYSGNWAVLNTAEVPGNEGRWRIKDLSHNNTGCKFRLENLKSQTFLDGDSDNSVVLDDDDHNWWSMSYYPVTVYDSVNSGLSSAYTIKNVDWSGEFYLYNKENAVKDVVLRKDQKTKFYFIRTTKK